MRIPSAFEDKAPKKYCANLPSGYPQVSYERSIRRDMRNIELVLEKASVRRAVAKLSLEG
jgi:hypothetical protein